MHLLMMREFLSHIAISLESALRFIATERALVYVSILGVAPEFLQTRRMNRGCD